VGHFALLDPDPILVDLLRNLAFAKLLNAVFRIRSHMFVGLPDPDPLVRASNKNIKKNLDSYCFVTSFGLFSLEK
jgi:hypothetical protein